MVAAVLLVVVSSYRQNVHVLTPPGGATNEVVTTKSGCHRRPCGCQRPTVDYATAQPLISSAASIGSRSPVRNEHKVLFAVGAIVPIMAMNLRRLGNWLSVPTMRSRRTGTHARGGSDFALLNLFGPSPRL